MSGQFFYNRPTFPAQLNMAHPLTRGLVGCWVLNENSPNSMRAWDSSPYQNYGTVTGALGRWQGRSFDGTDDYIDCGNPGSLRLQYFEFLIWARATVGNSDLLSHAGESASGWHLTLQANEILFGDNFVSNHTDWNPASFDPRDGVWRLYGFYRDTDDSTGITVNGEVVYTSSYAGTHGFTGNVQIGRRSSAQGNYLTGTEAQVIGYNRKLTAGERRQIYLEPYAMFL